MSCAGLPAVVDGLVLVVVVGAAGHEAVLDPDQRLREMPADAFPRLNELRAEPSGELFPHGRIRRRVVQVEPAVLRAGVTEKLVDALNVVEGLAKSSPMKASRGSGGIPLKARWYQIMADIAQILDGVLRNVQLGDVEDKLETLEKAVEELQRQTPQTTG